MPDTDRQITGRYGALKSWANTPDRTTRTRKARSNSPSDISWHLARLQPERFVNASHDDRLKAAGAAKKAYYVDLALKSVAARRGTPAETIGRRS